MTCELRHKSLGKLLSGDRLPRRTNGAPNVGLRGDDGSQVRLRLAAGGGSLKRTRLWSSNSLLAGSLQGISSIRGSAARERQQKRALDQAFTSLFPTHPNREFFSALQGI